MAVVNKVARLAEEQISFGPSQPGQRLDRTRRQGRMRQVELRG
jgi:hypothetical protein